MTREELEENDEFTVDSTVNASTGDDDLLELDFDNEVEEVKPEETEEEGEIEEIKPEEEVEEQEEQEEELEGEEEENTEDDDEVFTPFVNLLTEKGVLSPNPDKEYEDSEDGLAEIVTDTIESKFKEKLDGLSPQARRLLEIEEKGGDLREAFEELYSFDYNTIDMTDESNKVELVKEHLLSQGYEEADLDEQIEGLKDLNRLDKAATVAQKFFVNKQEAERESYVTKLDQQKATEEAARQESLQKVMQTIDTVERLGAFDNIPKADREAFKKYLFDKGEDGKTQAERDNSLEAILTNEFNKFKKFDYSGLQRRATTKATIDWKTKARRARDANQEAKGSTQKRYVKPADNGAFALGELDED